MFRFLLVFLIFAFYFLPVVAQEADDDDCPKQIEYINRNQVDPPTISLHGVEGRAIDSSGVAIGYICVALFTEVLLLKLPPMKTVISALAKFRKDATDL